MTYGKKMVAIKHHSSPRLKITN